eukprot:m.102746 g.102746  ORF g.102746 m.102746 type:complete len:430 (-) comp12548_c0_seq4:3008-4297(-)
MFGRLPLMVFCATKILLDDYYGNPHPDAGFCGGVSGYDCVCGDSTDSAPVRRTEAAGFPAWYENLDGMARQEGDNVDAEVEAEAIIEAEPQIEATVDATVSEVGATAKRTPPPILVLEDGSRILFNAEIMKSTEGMDMSLCQDKNENCSWWAEIGECYKNPGYLIQNCPKACNYCRAALPEAVRCVRDKDAIPLVQSPGGLNKMFQDIIANERFKEMYNTTVMSTEPYILLFDNFAHPGDWEGLENMLAGTFEGSTVVGKMTDDGKIGRQHLITRTSRNAWCMQSPCLHSKVHADLQNRLTELLGVGSPAYMESLQVLKYQVGQYYNTHHDTITDQITMMSGPRMLTAFIYFNEVEGGGETDFPRLGIKVKPAPGRMVLWPSQKDEDSLLVDDRTYHEACNVTKGYKNAANLWVHLYDYQTPYVMGCAG